MTDVAPRVVRKGYVSGWDAEMRQLSQSEAGYSAYGAVEGKGCATCRWWISPNSCVLVSGDIAVTGMSKYYAAPVPYTPEPIDVRIVKEAGVSEAGDGPFSKVIKTLKSFIANLRDTEVSKPISAFWVEKSDEGYRVWMVYSNIFKDEHKEIITTAAHKEYVNWVDTTGVYPEFHVWHAGPLSRFGQADFVDFVDGFAIASGPVDKDKEYVAEALELEAANLGVSHGFFGLKDLAGTYHLYRSFELSPLPAAATGNKWTAIDLSYKENLMPFTAEKKKFLKEKLGVTDARILEMEASVSELSTNLKALGLEYKEDGVVEATPETVAAAPAAVAASAGVDLGALMDGMHTMQQTLGALAGAVAGLKSGLDVATKEIGDVKTAQTRSVETAAGDLNLARVAAAAQGAGFQASRDPSTVTKEAAAVTDDLAWFDGIAIAPLRDGSAAVGAAT